MTHAKFHFNQLMFTLIFGIRASEPFPFLPGAWRKTGKAGPVGLIGLMLVDTHLCSILKMLCKRKIEQIIEIFCNLYNGHFVKGSTDFTVSYDPNNKEI